METDQEQSNSKPPTKRRGRPPKTGKKAVGRPKGTSTIMAEYRDRMLNSPKSRKVLDSLMEVANDPEHKHWPAAVKMVMDRVAPVSVFEQEIIKNGGRPSISINITGITGDVSVGQDSGQDSEGEIIEGEIVNANP